MLAKNVNITYIFDQRNSFNNLIPSSPSCTFESPQKKNRHSIFLKEILTQSLVKIRNENNISMPIHSGITYF